MYKNRIVKFIVISFLLIPIFSKYTYAQDPITKIVNIVFVGEKSSGKTFFRKALEGKLFADIRANQGNTSDTICVSKDITYDETEKQNLKLMMYDTSGFQEVAEQVKSKLTKEAFFVVITIDGTSLEREGAYYTYENSIVDKNIVEWYNQILKYNDYRKNLYFILLGTKSDLLNRSIEQGMQHSQYDCLVEQLEGFVVGHKARSNYIMSSVTENGYVGIEEFKQTVCRRIRDENLYNTLPIDKIEINLHDFQELKLTGKRKCVLL